MHVLAYASESPFLTALGEALTANDDFLAQTAGIDEVPAYDDFYDLGAVLLDPWLEDGAAFRWLKAQRAAGSMVIALVLVPADDTAAGPRAVNPAAWLEFADDLVRLPAAPAEIIARIGAIARRRRNAPDARIAVDNVVLDTRAKRAAVDGAALHLTGKEYALLHLLIARRNTVVTREMVLNELYGGLDEPELKIIDVFICKLRKKLAVAGVADNFIATVWGRGFSVSAEARADAAERHVRYQQRPDRYGAAA